MGRIFVIEEGELRSLIGEAVNNAVDNITRKITARSARRNYRNRLFTEVRHVPVSCGDDEPWSCGSSPSRSTGGCGSDADDGGCGSSRSPRHYNEGGCGSSSRSTGGC